MNMKKLAVVGGGTMGIGIAYVSALSGAEVVLVEPSDCQAGVVSDNIASAAAGGVARNKFSRAEADALIARISRVADVGGCGGWRIHHGSTKLSRHPRATSCLKQRPYCRPKKDH